MIPACFRRWSRPFVALRRDRRGSVAVTFGIVAIPVVVMMGAAVDYSLANRAKSQLNGIADSTALAMLSPNLIDLPPNMASDKAKQMMKAHAANVKRISGGEFSATVTDNLGKRTVVVGYEAKMSTTFMGLVSINSIELKGEAKSQKDLPAVAAASPAQPSAQSEASGISAEQAVALRALADRLGVQIVIPAPSAPAPPAGARLIQ